MANARNEQREGGSPEVVNYQGLGVVKPRKDLAYEMYHAKQRQTLEAAGFTHKVKGCESKDNAEGGNHVISGFIQKMAS